MGESDRDVFFSLEDDDPKPSSKSPEVPTQLPVEEPFEEEDVEILDPEIIMQATGDYKVEWPLIGMDCPDCASKATKALNLMPQVSVPTVSATSGEVKLSVDLEKGALSEVSSVLRSLGHAPDTEHHHLKGVKAANVAKRNNTTLRELKKLFRLQPGILDADIEKDGRILLQMVTSGDQELLKKRDEAIEQVCGSAPRYVATTSNRLRPDQFRLLGAAFALPLLFIIIFLEVIGIEGWIPAAIAIPGILVSSYQMFREAIASVMNRQLGFQVLTSLAVIGACGLMMWEEALIVAILVALTAHLEGDALAKAREAMQGGLDRLPRVARRVQSKKSFTPSAIQIGGVSSISLPMASTVVDTNSEPEQIPLELLSIGDHIEIRSGELVPADGRIIEGRGALNKAPLTGESVPVDVEEGDFVQAGLVLARGPIILEVEAVGEETQLFELIEAVHTFRDEPPRLQASIERFTAIWVPIVLFGAFGVYWFLYPDNWKIILLLWVVACPCALLLAAPVPHAAALANSAHMGAIARGGNVLERLAKVNHVFLDKTGTLTSGKPSLGKVVMAKGRRHDASVALAAGIESRSSHPYAEALREFAQHLNIEPIKVKKIKDVNAGIQAMRNKEEVLMLRPDALSDHGIDISSRLKKEVDLAESSGHGASILTKGGKCVALFTFIHDDTLQGADELIPELHKMGIHVQIISGDQQGAVDRFASSVGLPRTDAFGNQSPEDKVAVVRSRSDIAVTMMVGDGFNDAAALAVADVGVAVGSGESVNVEAADVMIPGDDPRMLADLLKLARRTERNFRQNLSFSILVTVTLVYAVVNGFYDALWIGVLVHEMSVILVILNGARLAEGTGTLTLVKNTFIAMWEATLVALQTGRKQLSEMRS
ncbi:MAG: heavy metal translocating P-type ATPase [Candidatus Poseidoniaceae archaeon]|jgi:Cd2+/Zn2+-exporting ATPase|nr:heavy metal translocating P-type ATPase [Candidatus Poseidoniaceae archaeon]